MNRKTNEGQVKIDNERLKQLRAYDYQSSERRMFNKVEGKMWVFFNDTALDSGYNYRDGQYDMAEGVLDAICYGRNLAVEAGVGIGKSYGYLVPLLLYHEVTGAPVVIATSTIALQEQLASDLENLMEVMGSDIPFIVAKGQNNYICIRRAKAYIKRWGDTKTAQEVAHGLSNSYSDRKEYPADLSDKEWSSINIRNYKRKDCGLCPHSEECYYHQMRQELPKAGMVICNQDFLIAHFRLEEQYNTHLLNPDMKVIVIDEAHNLEGKTRYAYTGRISARNLLETAKSAEMSVIKREGQGVSDSLQGFMDSVGQLFANVRKQAIEQSRWELKRLSEETKESGYQYSKDELFEMLEVDRFFFNDVDGAYSVVRTMIEQLNALVKYHSSPRNGWTVETEQLDAEKTLRDSLLEFKGNMSSYVLWSERVGKDWQLCYCPKDIASICYNTLFQGLRKVILTSATMTGLGSGSEEERYSFWARGVGFPKELKAASSAEIADMICKNILYGSLMPPIPSPYNYSAHTMLYYTNDMPHPTKEHERFLKEGIQRLREILDISEGRALVLFTSKSDMYRTAQELRKMNLPYTILVQGHGSSQKDILDAFRGDEHAVLLGTGSYWEGISVEGATLSNLVIFRLPFAVPDPITAQKEAMAENPLLDVRVPEMIIRLKQGVGRLIRNEEDKGIVSIIDGRMGDESTVPYKDMVWDALPIKNRTSNLDEIRQFYKEVVLGSEAEKQDDAGGEAEYVAGGEEEQAAGGEAKFDAGDGNGDDVEGTAGDEAVD